MKKFVTEILGSTGNKYEVSIGFNAIQQLYVNCTCPAKGLCRHMSMAVVENVDYQDKLNWPSELRELAIRLNGLLTSRYEIKQKIEKLQNQSDMLQKEILNSFAIR